MSTFHEEKKVDHSNRKIDGEQNNNNNRKINGEQRPTPKTQYKMVGSYTCASICLLFSDL